MLTNSEHDYQYRLAELNSKIVLMKRELNVLAQEYGINHELTIKKSKELDTVINEYMGFKKQGWDR